MTDWSLLVGVCENFYYDDNIRDCTLYTFKSFSRLLCPVDFLLVFLSRLSKLKPVDLAPFLLILLALIAAVSHVISPILEMHHSRFLAAAFDSTSYCFAM